MAFKTLGSGDGEDSSEIFAEINITPLTDVFLVLLIIFMVTTSVMSQMGVNVHLPQASQATTQAQPEGVIITLLPSGGIRLNQQSFSAGDWVKFGIAIKAAFLKTSSRLVILEGDRDVLLGSAIETIDHARKYGAEKFAIATLPEETGRSPRKRVASP